MKMLQAGRIMITAGLGACLVLTAGSLAAAATNYVALHSGGTYDGASWATAFTNLQEAVTAGGSNSVVFVAGGTYPLPAALAITATNVLIRGGYEGTGSGAGNHDPLQWPTTLSRGGASHRIVLISGGHDARVEHVTITGGNINLGAGVHVENSVRVVLTGCTIRNNGYSANTGSTHAGGGIYAAAGTSLTLSDCIVLENVIYQSNDGAAIAQGGGIYAVGTLLLRDTVIVNNSLTHSGANKTQGSGLYFAGVALDLHNVRVTGNAVSRLDAAGGIQVRAGTATLRNCTVADHATAGIVRVAPAILTITNSIVWGNWGDIIGTATVGYSNIGDTDFGGSNIQADPAFEAGYYLAAGSQCLGAGSATATSLGLAAYAKNVAGDTYGSGEIVNLGYHYADGFARPYPDLYVSTTGNDTLNTGTNSAQAFRTLTKALATAHADTRIHVAAGTYTRTTETFPLALTDQTGVTIIGTNAALTRIDAAGSGKRVMTLLRTHRLRLSGLTLTGGSGISGAGLSLDNSQGVSLADCAIAKNQYAAKQVAIQGGGIFASLSSEVSLTNCVVQGNQAYNQHDPTTYRAYGGGIWSGGRLAIRDSFITNNIVRQVSSLYLPGGSGIHFAGDRLAIVNSLVAGNHEYANRPVGGIQIAAGTAELASLTIVGNGTAGLYRTGGSVNVVNSILWGNGLDSTGTVSVTCSCVSNSTDYVDGGQNVSGNPSFAGPTDYRLQDDSSCINQGQTQAWMSTAFDLSGQKRILGGRVDIGAYEWMPPQGTLFIVH